MDMTVKQDPDNPIGPEIMEQAIVNIGAAMKRIQATRLTQRAIILLVVDNTSPKLSYRDVKAVLESLASLERMYLKPEPIAKEPPPTQSKKRKSAVTS